VAPPLAHETWFVVDNVPGDWGFAGETLTLLFLALTLVLTLAVLLVARIWPGADIPSSGAWRRSCPSPYESILPFP
jgi:hypothetical protein